VGTATKRLVELDADGTMLRCHSTPDPPVAVQRASLGISSGGGHGHHGGRRNDRDGRIGGGGVSVGGGRGGWSTAHGPIYGVCEDCLVVQYSGGRVGVIRRSDSTHVAVECASTEVVVCGRVAPVWHDRVVRCDEDGHATVVDLSGLWPASDATPDSSTNAFGVSSCAGSGGGVARVRTSGVGGIDDRAAGAAGAAGAASDMNAADRSASTKLREEVLAKLASAVEARVGSARASLVAAEADLARKQRFLTEVRARLSVGGQASPLSPSSVSSWTDAAQKCRGAAGGWGLGKRALVPLWEPTEVGTAGREPSASEGGAAAAVVGGGGAGAGGGASAVRGRDSAVGTSVAAALDVVSVECTGVPPAQASVVVTLRNIGAVACSPHIVVVATDRRPLSARCVCQPHAIVRDALLSVPTDSVGRRNLVGVWLRAHFGTHTRQYSYCSITRCHHHHHHTSTLTRIPPPPHTHTPPPRTHTLPGRASSVLCPGVSGCRFNVCGDGRLGKSAQRRRNCWLWRGYFECVSVCSALPRWSE
jgi:hypothetical protein